MDGQDPKVNVNDNLISQLNMEVTVCLQNF